MKQLMIGIVVVVMLLGVSVRSQQTVKQSHASVILLATPNVLYDDKGSAYYDGITVYCASSSDGAPRFPQYPNKGIQLAEAEAQLLDAGFHLDRSDNFSYHWIR